MSSPWSDALENALNKKAEELKEKQKNRIEIAMEQTEARVKEQIGAFIKDGLQDYYEGYDPVMYVRTEQLMKSGAASPKTESFKKNGLVGFRYGARFDPDRMDHSVYELKIVYKHKKDSGQWEKKYTYHDDDVNEQDILDNFRFGLHPLGARGAFIDQGIFWKMENEGGREGSIVDAIIQWKQSGAIKNIFLEELKKLKK